MADPRGGLVQGFIIGAQKAGSTSLDRYLAAHPDVWAVRHEVPAFEDPDFGSGAVTRLREWLTGAEGARDKTVVLRRPNYLCDPVVPARMRDEWPDVRLVAVLRDPVDRAVSAYFHYMRYGLLPVAPPEEGLRALLADPHRPGWPRSHEVLTFGLYGTGVNRWRHVFGPRQLLLLDTALLRADPRAALSAVARHLAIRSDVEIPSVRDGMPGSYDMGRVRARARLLPVLYRRENNHRLTPRWVLPQLYDRAERRFWPDSGRAPVLSPALRAALREHYREDMTKLSELMPGPRPRWIDSYISP